MLGLGGPSPARQSPHAAALRDGATVVSGGRRDGGRHVDRTQDVEGDSLHLSAVGPGFFAMDLPRGGESEFVTVYPDHYYVFRVGGPKRVVEFFLCIANAFWKRHGDAKSTTFAHRAFEVDSGPPVLKLQLDGKRMKVGILIEPGAGRLGRLAQEGHVTDEAEGIVSDSDGLHWVSLRAIGLSYGTASST